MGNAPSKQAGPDPVLAKRLVEQLQNLAVEENNANIEKDYVHVTDEKSSQHATYQSTVSISTTQEWEQKLMQDPKNRLALSALSSTDPLQVLSQRSAFINTPQTFNVKIPLEGAPITNQYATGRCWLFAATNVLRVALMRKHNLAELELSQAYLFYWDKIEKANYFLEQIIDTASEDVEGRLVQRLLSSPVGDGGQWDMVVNLVAKYGVVPHSLYPDTFSGANSRTMDHLLTLKLRENALQLRALISQSSSSSTTSTLRATLGAAKQSMMREIHTIVTLLLGPPPPPDKPFTWTYYDKTGKFHSLSISPKDFAAELSSSVSVKANGGADVNQLFSLVNDPRNEYGQHLTVARLGNVYGGKPVRYVNAPMKVLEGAAIAMLKAGLPVFFGSDVGQYSDRIKGIMNTGIVDFELGFNVRLGMDKTQRIVTGESAMTHAMVLTGVQVEDGRAVRWRVQNSWGTAVGKEGWFVMGQKWFEEYAFQVVVEPGFVGKEWRDVLKKEPVVLPLWDPMGALA